MLQSRMKPAFGQMHAHFLGMFISRKERAKERNLVSVLGTKWWLAKALSQRQLCLLQLERMPAEASEHAAEFRKMFLTMVAMAISLAAIQMLPVVTASKYTICIIDRLQKTIARLFESKRASGVLMNSYPVCSEEENSIFFIFVGKGLNV